MIALFKSHYSIGKSILTLDHPDKVQEGGPNSVFNISKENRLTLVEDSLIGFLQAQKIAKELNIQLVFGLRLQCSHEDEIDSNSQCLHKIIVFAKNDTGCKLLNTIYSKAFCDHSGVITFPALKKLWSNDDLYLAVPFYDSFIFMNSMHFCSCIPDFSFCDPIFFIENNYLPFDIHIQNKVKEYCTNFNYQHILTKSIFYPKREDFEAYQTYKCICQRKAGKQKTLAVPNFDHLASPEFCYESYLEHESA